MPPFIECVDFGFSYGKSRILDNITFKLHKGEWLSIMGPNGSGKSTLLKNLASLVKGKMKGEILLNGKVLSKYRQKELARLLAYTPQPDNIVPPFTVREFLDLSRYAFQERGAFVDAAMELAGILPLANVSLRELSGGQRQRVFIAAALAQGAQALLLDEPTSFLDPKNSSLIMNLLRHLHRDKKYTIILVTHDLSFPIAAGGKALVLKEGRQLYFGNASDLPALKILDQAFDYRFTYLAYPGTGRPVVLA